MRVERISIEELAEAAKATHSHFADHPLIAGMTEAQAAWVRVKRCEEGLTWRGVADACDALWFGDWGDNQLAGIALCEKAASFYGEDAWNGPPWNG